MNIVIEIIKVSAPEHKSGKGRGYDVIEITYKDLKAGKVGGKKLVSFGDYAHVYEAAKDWEEGQEVEVEIQKVDGYWNWVNVVNGNDRKEPQPEPNNSKTAGIARESTKAAGKQQWVPDEVRQRLIVRQSSLAQAVAHEKDNATTLDIVLATAERFFDWVMEVEEKTEAPKRGRKPKAVEPVTEAEID